MSFNTLRWESISCDPRDTVFNEHLPQGGGVSHTIMDEHRFAVFGGLGSRRYNELFIFNTRENEWFKASMENAPSRRCKASLCCRKIETTTTTTTECSSSSSSSSSTASSSHSHSPSSTASSRNTSATCSEENHGHVVGKAWNYKLYVFGGWTSEGKTNDLYEYDVAKDEWKQLKPNNSFSPPARSAHYCCCVGKYMYLYGGIGNKKYGDMYRYHFDKNEWECVNAMQGDVPLPRSSYGGLLVLEGGGGGTKSNTQFFVTCGLGCGRYNDTYLYEVQSKRWTCVKCSGDIPSKRGRHSCVLHEETGNVILYGGFTGTECSGECFSFNLVTKEWKMLQQINPPPKRESACCVILNNKLYMFGGWGGDAKFFNDMYVASFE